MYNIKWVPVPQHNGFYEMNEYGQFRSLHKRHYHTILPHRIDRAGYYTVRLSKFGKVNTYYVHRLLALAFIPNPEMKPRINHKDLNKLNNSLENLEWVTHSENILHAYKNGAIKARKGKDHPKAQPVLFKTTGEKFYTMKDAAQGTGSNYKTFTGKLRRNRHSEFEKIKKTMDK